MLSIYWTHWPPGHHPSCQEISSYSPTIGPTHGLKHRQDNSVNYCNLLLHLIYIMMCTHPDANTDDNDEISNNDGDVCWIVDGHRVRRRRWILHCPTCAWKQFD